MRLFKFSGPPVFVEPPIPATVIKDQLLHLRCFITAIPVATVSWYRGNNELMEGGRISFRYDISLIVYSHLPEPKPGQGPGTIGLYATVWKLWHYT